MNVDRENVIKWKLSDNKNESTIPCKRSKCTVEEEQSDSLRYPGDVKDDHAQNPKKALEAFHVFRNKISQYRKKIKSLENRRHYGIKEANDMKIVIEELQRKFSLSDKAKETLMSQYDEKSILDELKCKRSKQYSPELRSFASTLHFYSPKSYSYVRKTFGNKLPHPETLRKWYRSVDGKPGFLMEAPTAIKIKTEKKKVHCNLILDEVYIKKHIQWNNVEKRYVGVVDLGDENNYSDEPATEALTFCLNAIDDRWKIPTGYFLIHGLSAKEKSNIVLEMLRVLNETNVEIVSLTYDGNATNISMTNLLWCNFKIYKSFLNGNKPLNTQFVNPVNKNKINVFLDVCHMLKLLRNTLSNKGCLIDPEGKLLEWKYFEYLEELQAQEGLRVANNLSKHHLKWQSNKMKTKLAAQTFSRSVADALKYCLDSKIERFEGCEPLIKFIILINDLFDVLNSKSTRSTGFKEPITTKNCDAVWELFARSESYIKNLKIHQKDSIVPILKSRNKTGFLGFLVAIQSTRNVFTKYVQTRKLKYLMMYKFSQDHIEQLFSVIRSRGGFSNNPTASQLMSTFKRILVRNELSCFSNGNSTPLDDTTFLFVKSSSPKQCNTLNKINNFTNRMLDDKYERKEDEMNVDESEDESLLLTFDIINRYQAEVVEYVAGFVEKKILTKIKCQECINALTIGDTCTNDFIRIKNRGGLGNPQLNVAKICKIGEQTIRGFHFTQYPKTKNYFATLISKSTRNITSDVLDNMTDHINEQEPIDNHRNLLIKLILEEFFKIRCHHVARKWTLNLQGSYVRRQLSKEIHFQGQ